MISGNTEQRTPTSLGVEVRSLRDRAGLTQLELSKRARVERSALSKVETGDDMPSEELCDRLSRELGVEAWHLRRLRALDTLSPDQRRLFAETAPRSQQEAPISISSAARELQRVAAELEGATSAPELDVVAAVRDLLATCQRAGAFPGVRRGYGAATRSLVGFAKLASRLDYEAFAELMVAVEALTRSIYVMRTGHSLDHDPYNTLNTRSRPRR